MKLDKKNILIALSVTVVVILLGVAAFLLVRGIMQFNASEARLLDAKKKLKELYDRKPFPSQSNISKETDNVNLLVDWFKQLTGVLRKGQIEPLQSSPSKFMSLLQSKRPELLRQANESSKAVADDFGFGFERYLSANSALPEPADVPRLTQQLTIIEKICGVLFSEKIEQLTMLQREIFETASDSGSALTPATGGGRGARGRSAVAVAVLENKGAGVLEAEDLYAKFHFNIEFKAKEPTVFNVLNKLARHEMYIVITSLEIKKESLDSADIKARLTPPAVDESRVSVSDPLDTKQEKPAHARKPKAETAKHKAGNVPTGENAMEPESKSPQAKPSDEKPDRNERVVCGLEMEKAMKIKIEMDVYRFRGE